MAFIIGRYAMKFLAMPALAGAITAFSTLLPGGASAQTEFTPQTFTYAAWITPELGHALAVIDFFEGVTARTNGAITFQPFWHGALCGAIDALDCVSSGQVDVVFGSAIFNPAELPLTTIASVPFQTTNPQASTNTMNSLYADYEPIQAEWSQAGAHLLWFAHGALPLIGTTRPIETLKDVEGRSIRTVGYIVQPMAALGANAVATAPAEQYEALQRGVVDGVIYTSDGYIDSRLYEVVDYLYDIGEYMGVYAMLYNAMNQSVWEGMSPELQAIFTEEAARVAAIHQSKYMEPFDERACEVLAKEISTIGRFGDEASAQEWAKEQHEAAAGEWIASVGRSGVAEADAIALRDEFRTRVAAFEQTETGHRSGGEICIQAKAAQ